MDDLPALPILEAPSRPNSPSLTHIFDLPEELIVDILSRLDSDHLARSRVVSKAFSDISTKVRSVNLLCSLDRYTNFGQPITPFKKIVTDLILSMGDVDSVSFGVEERANHKSLEIKLDDLYLTEVSFVYRWLKRVCGGLTSLSISNYRMHSHRKWSEVLSLISFHCTNLHELVLKNAWLSTKGMSSAMFKLTSLTLACVRLDDEDLDKVNSCCPSLQILNLILVEGLKNPQIDLLQLRTCQYVGSSLATTTPLQVIRAPNLTRIEVGFEVGFGQRILYIIKTLQRMHSSRRTQIVFVPASDFAKITGAPTHFDQNTSFGDPIENYLNLISRNASTNHPVLLQNKLILVSVKDWALGIQKSPNFRCTQIFLPFEFEWNSF